MRTIKASEVRKGMRVRAESTEHNVTVRVEGEVCEARTINNEQVALTFEDGTQRFYAGDHPVTVLAEPEPEWVEGAWYRFTTGGERRYLGRVENGELVEPDGTEYSAAYVTVLGRVLIVDWPGDDLARDILEGYSDSRDDFTIPANQMAVKVADAIRTQGGAS